MVSSGFSRTRGSAMRFIILTECTDYTTKIKVNVLHSAPDQRITNIPGRLQSHNFETLILIIPTILKSMYVIYGIQDSTFLVLSLALLQIYTLQVMSPRLATKGCIHLIMIIMMVALYTILKLRTGMICCKWSTILHTNLLLLYLIPTNPRVAKRWSTSAQIMAKIVSSVPTVTRLALQQRRWTYLWLLWFRLPTCASIQILV